MSYKEITGISIAGNNEGLKSYALRIMKSLIIK